MLSSASVIISIYVACFAAFYLWIRPWQSKILTHGKSPDGLEYCVVQTYKDFVEPYQVSFYIRDTNGLWRWNYLEHEDGGWRSARVAFSNGTALVFRNGEHFRDVPPPTGMVEVATVPSDYRDDYCPARFSAEDVLRFHNEKCK